MTIVDKSSLLLFAAGVLAGCGGGEGSGTGAVANTSAAVGKVSASAPSPDGTATLVADSGTIGSGKADATAMDKSRSRAPAPAPGGTRLANEGQTFTVTQLTMVRFGKGNSWVQQTVPPGMLTMCSTDVFGNPGVPAPRVCEAVGSAPAPAPAPAQGPAAPQATPDVVSADDGLYSSVPFGQVPPNSFWYLNNLFGKGPYINGGDYTTTLTAYKDTFPRGSLIEWRWPDAGSGSDFAFGYPEILYGGGAWGSAFNTVGPWPQKINAVTRLNATYDITLGGNTHSYDILMDLFVTTLPNSTDGSRGAEISFFPHMEDPSNLTGTHEFASFGRASVTKQGTQILIRPVSDANAPRDILAATIDLKEVFGYLISIGLLTGEEYLRGVEFGPEIQVPNFYNSTPHIGSMKVNQLSYDWH